MQHVVEQLFDSELFEYHYERMVGIMMGDAQQVSVPSTDRLCGLF